MPKKRNTVFRIFNSAGIACCRWIIDKRTHVRKPQILLVQKRYTYQFIEFVLGRYNNNDNSRLHYLFSHMTPTEKMDILTFNFDLLWSKLWFGSDSPGGVVVDESFVGKSNLYNRLWATTSTNTLYLRYKFKFETLMHTPTPQCRESMIRIRNLIYNSKNAAQLWEIPKGRCKMGESELSCALREFIEETSLGIDQIQLRLDIPAVKEIFRDDGVEYNNTYYIAQVLSTMTYPDIRFRSGVQTFEVDNVRWMSRDDIKFFIGTNGRLVHLTNQIFSILKKNKHF
jgi:8-oxo-dGTP pyrophosphatase MutT (NUDIX family)